MSKPEIKTVKSVLSERSEDTKRRLIEAGITLFAQAGYEGTTTRELADAAGANLAAIPYHFGGKDGLYLAVAQSIVADIEAMMGQLLSEANAELDANPSMTKDQAIGVAERALTGFARMILVAPETQQWARFMLREQIDPTKAFDIVYDSPLKSLREVIVRVVSMVSGIAAHDPRVRITGVQLLGLIYVLRSVNASFMKMMGWDKIDEDRFALIQSMIATHTRSMLNGLGNAWA